MRASPGPRHRSATAPVPGAPLSIPLKHSRGPPVYKRPARQTEKGAGKKKKKKKKTEHGLPKLPCASCYVQVLCAGCSAQAAALCASCSAQVLPELSGSTSHPGFLIEKLHYAAGTAGLYSSYYSCTCKFRFSSRTLFALKRCDFCLEKLPRKAGISNSQKTISFWTSTTRISAEGRARTAEIVKSPHFFDLDHTNLRRGSRAHCAHRTNRKSLNFLISTTRISAKF